MDILHAEWFPWAVSGFSALLLLIWYFRLAKIMAPESGTLEWIARVDRNCYAELAWQPIRGRGLVVLLLITLLGAGKAAFLTDWENDGFWLNVGLTAAQNALCGLALLLLYGVPAASFCGAVLLLAADLPAPVLLGCLFLLFLSLGVRQLWLQILLYIPAVIVLLTFVGTGFSVFLILVGYILLYLILVPLHRAHSVWDLAGRLALLFLIPCVVVISNALVIHGADMAAVEAVGEMLCDLVRWTPVWHPWVNGTVLLTGTAIFVLLHHASRLRDTRWLFGATAGLLSLQQLFCGAPEMAGLGCILALTGTFAAAFERRGKTAAAMTAALLTICILIS